MVDCDAFAILDLPSRLVVKIRREPKTKCWLWQSSINNDGYGQVSWRGKPRGAHRIVYQLLKGKIPQGCEIDHLCRVKNCVNPAHLEAVTPMQNTRRGMRSRGVGPPMHSIGFKVDGELRRDLEQYHKEVGKKKGEANRELLRFALDHIPRK